MWITFWSNNAHFALEFFGAVILFVLAWLAFDAFLLKREFKTLARSLGFLFFAFWMVVHSLNITNDFALLVAGVSYFLGLLFILLNLYWEKPPARPKFEAVLILPAFASVLWQLHIVATILLFLTVVLSFKRFKAESQKNLRPFLIAFSFLTLASALAVLNARGGIQGLGWIFEHVLKMIGYGFLGFWGWQYLKLRIKEEMLLVFVGMALFISVIVTLTFSAILLKNMENEAEANLISNVKVVDYTFLRMRSESLSNAQIFAKDGEIISSLKAKDFGKLEERAGVLMAEKTADFLTVADNKGEVILRVHALSAKGDSIQEEKAGSEALAGKSYATVEGTQTEKFSIRGAAPIYDSQNNILGAVITGFIIDNAFVDKIKKATDLEVTIYKEDAVQATTIFDAAGKTRNVGAKQTDSQVIEKVLQEGQGTTLRTTIFSKPYLAAYLPLKNAEGETVGMFQASRPQTELAETAFSANRLTLFVTVIIVIMMLMPAYWLAKKLSDEV